MTPALSRRGLLGYTGALAGWGLLAPAAPAVAAPDAAALPKVGESFTLSLSGFGATLVVNLPPPLPILDFLGSRVVKVLRGDDADSVRLKTLEFSMEAMHPVFGRVTLGLLDTDDDPPSSLRRQSGALVETWYQSITVIFEKCGDCQGPFALRTLSPARWTARLSDYPPPPQSAEPGGAPTGGRLYRATEPIRIGLRANGSGASTTAASGECAECPLTRPLSEQDDSSGRNPGTGDGVEYVRLQGFDINQGRLPG
ncbi:hypothetical protein ACWDSJ_20860 [Nocardia sp. NPDC003482]